MAVIKYKDKNGEWKELAVLKGDSGVAPIINPDTNTWLVWDNKQGVYVDTGVVAGVGTEDFYASTYWVFNEMASGKKVIADALTERNYPTDKSESFNDMAQKITDMSYGLGVFEKIGYTDENASALQEMIDYSYELAKGWNPDGSTSQMFRGNKKLVFAPMVDTSKYENMSYVFYGCSLLAITPKYDLSNCIKTSNLFYNCSSLGYISSFDMRNVTDASLMFYGCKSLIYLPMLDTRNVTNMSQFTYGCDNLRRIEGLYLNKVTNHFFSYNNFSIVFAKFYNLGMSSMVTHNFSEMNVWGTGGEENRQSLIDSLITYSYDRASNGMATATIKLSATTKELLTEEEIAQITAKGFTIA